MVCDDACHPFGRDSHPRQASSLTARPPILASSWGLLMEADRHCVLQLQPQLQPKRKQGLERRLQCRQDWKYLGGDIDEDSQTLVMGFCCP